MSDSTAFERVLALTGIQALSELHPDDLASLAERVQERRAAPGERWGAGDVDGVLWLLLAGQIEILPDRRAVEAPALAGAVELLAGSIVSARAGSQGAHAFTLDRDALAWVMSDVFEVWVAMLRHVARRWADAEHPTLAPAGATRAGTSADPAALVARMRLLSGSDLLGSLRAHTLGRLAKEMQEYRLRAGASLWETDACSDDCFVLVEGRLCVEGLSDDLQAPGTVVGLGEALARTAPRRAVVAEAGARLLRLSSEVLIDELEDDPDTATALLGALARHVLRVESAVVRP